MEIQPPTSDLQEFQSVLLHRYVLQFVKRGVGGQYISYMTDNLSSHSSPYKKLAQQQLWSIVFKAQPLDHITSCFYSMPARIKNHQHHVFVS